MAIGVLIIVAVTAVIASGVWARIDAKRRRHHPFLRSMSVAAALGGLFFAIVLFGLSSVSQQATAQGPVVYFIRWKGLLLMLGVMFAIHSFVGWLSYLISYGFAAHHDETTDGDEESTIQAEETGNPYQPPST